MEPIPKSGLYYPNKIARIALTAIEDVMGKNGLNAILNLAGLTDLIDNFPPDNLERHFDFAGFSGINGALEEMYGPRGGRGLALRAGRATFSEGLRNFGALAGAGDLAFKVLPLSAKLHIGLPAMAKIFTSTSDQLSTVEEKTDHFIYTIHRCPVCWGRTVDRPACFMAAGLIQEGLKWVSGGREFKVVQTTCHASGDAVCNFHILKRTNHVSPWSIFVNENKTTLLIVEDDLDIADMLNAYFRVQGYDVLTVNWGEDGIRSCLSETPDLVILDIRLPDIDGFEVAKRLRSNRKTKEIPIIFLTEKRERNDRLKGLELKADDYVTKPFDIQELRLRVRNALQRSRQGTLTNPVTGLPEGSLVDEALEASIGGADTVAMVVTLKNINRFREVYGFVASDDMLRAISLMIRDIVRDLSSPEDFIGHLTVADFLVLTRQAQLSALRERLRKRLEQSFDYFYSDQDREQGTFRDQLLGVQINEIILSTLSQHDLSYIKAELEQFCHQANLK